MGLLEHNCEHRRALKRYVPGLRRGPHNLPGVCVCVCVCVQHDCIFAAQLMRLYMLTQTRLLSQILTSRGIDIGKLSAIG